METLITCLLLFLFVILIWKKIIFKNAGIPPLLIVSVFVFKFLLVSAFVKYLDVHREYDLKGDHEYYMNDTRILNHVFYENPTVYFKLLVGLDNTQATSDHYLSGVKLWNNSHKKFNDCRTVIRVHSVLYFLTRGNVFLHLLFVALLSTYTLILLTNVFEKYVRRKEWLFAFIGFCIPTFLIYGGLVLKEHLLFFGIAAFLFGLEQKNWKIPLLWLGLLFSLTIKTYVFLILLRLILFFYFWQKITNLTIKISYLVALFTLASVIYFSKIGDKFVYSISYQQAAFERVATKGVYLHDYAKETRSRYYYYLPVEDSGKLIHSIHGDIFLTRDLIAAKKDLVGNNFLDSAKLISGERYHLGMIVDKSSKSSITPYFVRNKKSNLLKGIPKSIENGLLLPTIFSPGSNAKYPAIAETLLVICFFIVAFCYAIKKNRQIFLQVIIYKLILFAVMLGFVVGVTTTVIGAIVRYRIPAYIAIIVLSFILIDPIWKRKSS